MINRRDARIGLVVLGILLVVLFFAAALLNAPGDNEVRVSKRSIAVIEISGPIMDPRAVVDALERYSRSNRIPAIVIRLDTPGGGVAATQEIYSTVLKVRHQGKKVVCSMGSVAASGGYYIAAACDSVMANPGTITGSIGVIADFAEISGLLKKVGVDITVIKSGKFKDIGSFSRGMTDEEKELIHGVIMDTYDQFVEAVSKGRRMDPEQVRKYADGRVFTGRQAKQYGFVDALGTYQDAVDMAGRMTGIGANPPVVKKEEERFWDMVTRGMSNLLSKGLELSFPRMSYILRY
jgi:protease IV